MLMGQTVKDVTYLMLIPVELYLVKGNTKYVVRLLEKLGTGRSIVGARRS